MCGIVAILTRPDGRAEPAPDDVLAALDAAVAVPLPPSADPAVVATAAAQVGAADGLLRGVAGVIVTHDAQLASWADRFVFVRDGRVVEMALRECLEAMVRAAGVEHVREQHRVVVRIHLDAALRKHLPGELDVVTHFEDAPALQQRG